MTAYTMTELPTPEGCMFNGEYYVDTNDYTADQMRDYGRAEYLRAIEDAELVQSDLENEITALRADFAKYRLLHCACEFDEADNVTKECETHATLREEYLRAIEAAAKVCEEMERNGAWITKEESAKHIRALAGEKT